MLGEVAEIYISLNDEEIVKIKETSTWEKITSHLRKFDDVAARL